MSEVRRRAPGRQMVLDLARAPSFDPDDFLVSSANADAHATIMRWPDWPARTLLLLGPTGSGKSHLGAIWAGLANAAPLELDALAAMSAGGPLIGVIEDGDRRCYPEAAFFHALNAVEEARGWLLITARTSPDLWGVGTPDLLSRLRRAPVAAIGEPDTALVRSVLVKLFADRQIRIEADVVAYAALHCDRSLEAVAEFVAAVDEAALAEGRRITRPLVARTLDKLRAADVLEKSTPDAGECKTHSILAQSSDHGPT